MVGNYKKSLRFWIHRMPDARCQLHDASCRITLSERARGNNARNFVVSCTRNPTSGITNIRRQQLNKKGEGRCSFTFLLSVDGKYHPFACVVRGLQLLFGKTYCKVNQKRSNVAGMPSEFFHIICSSFCNLSAVNRQLNYT